MTLTTETDRAPSSVHRDILRQKRKKKGHCKHSDGREGKDYARAKGGERGDASHGHEQRVKRRKKILSIDAVVKRPPKFSFSVTARVTS